MAFAPPALSIASSPIERRESHAELVSTTLDHPATRAKGFRDGLLQRGGYCCVVTGDMDLGHWESLDDPQDDTDRAPTEGAHIIPFSYATWDSKLNVSPDVPRSWEILWRCFPIIRAINFNHEEINSLSNGLTLTDWLHWRFRAFQIAFEPTEVENKYNIITFKAISAKYEELIPPTVDLENHDKENDRSLPSPILLDCHCRVAKILNASGMAEAFEFDFRKWEELKDRVGNELPEDGDIDIGEAVCVGLERYGYVIG